MKPNRFYNNLKGIGSLNLQSIENRIDIRIDNINIKNLSIMGRRPAGLPK
jgi:hypothetical protein